MTVSVTFVGATTVWLFPRFPDFSHPDKSPYEFKAKNVSMGYFTGLQVAHEPGQWAVWAGVILMGVGLVLAFYFVHIRFWVVPVSDGRGRMVIWAGASASKNREDLEKRFGSFVDEIERGLNQDCYCKNLQADAEPVRG